MKRKPTKREKLVDMLDAWGTYQAVIAPGIGWNINTLDFSGDVPHGVQKRNDVYSNPVDQEHKRMLEEQKVAMTVDTAVSELTRPLRRSVHAKHRFWPSASRGYIAGRLGISEKLFSKHLNRAYNALGDKLEALSIEYRASS